MQLGLRGKGFSRIYSSGPPLVKACPCSSHFRKPCHHVPTKRLDRGAPWIASARSKKDTERALPPEDFDEDFGLDDLEDFDEEFKDEDLGELEEGLEDIFGDLPGEDILSEEEIEAILEQQRQQSGKGLRNYLEGAPLSKKVLRPRSKGSAAGQDGEEREVDEQMGQQEDGDEDENVEGEEGEEEEGGESQAPRYAMYLPDLMAKAGWPDVAELLDENYHDLGIYGLENDPDEVVVGDLYFCHIGPNYDGHEWAIEAAQKGAVAIVANRELEGIPDGVPVILVEDVNEVEQQVALAFYDTPSLQMLTVGVAGTTGKTTVSWLIRGILEATDQKTGMIGTLEYALADDYLDPEGNIWEPEDEDPTRDRDCSAPFYITPYQGKYQVPETTPNGLCIQKLLASMRDMGGQATVIECDVQGLAERRTEFIDFDVAVFTNMYGDAEQLEYFDENEEEYVAAMTHLFSSLHSPSMKAAVVNLDDPAANIIKEAASRAAVVTYSMENNLADVFVEQLQLSIWETEVLVRTPKGKLQIITPLIGRHNVPHVLAAIATGIAVGASLEAIVAGIEAVEVIPGRAEIVDEGQPFPVVVDAANTPESLSTLLDSIRECGASRIFTVFGCEGDGNKEKRPYMGKIAHDKSDYVIITNCHPRTEDPGEIVQDIVAGFPDEIINKYAGYVYFAFQDQGRCPLWFEPYLQKAQRDTKRYVMEDRFSAIRAAIGTAQANDVVVLVGKGHEDYMDYGDEEGNIIRGWFDDRVEAKNALSKLTYLYQIIKLERKELPWGNTLDEFLTLI